MSTEEAIPTLSPARSAAVEALLASVPPAPGSAMAAPVPDQGPPLAAAESIILSGLAAVRTAAQRAHNPMFDAPDPARQMARSRAEMARTQLAQALNAIVTVIESVGALLDEAAANNPMLAAELRRADIDPEAALFFLTRCEALLDAVKPRAAAASAH